MQDSSSTQEHLVRLSEESERSVKQIQQSVEQKKKDVVGLLLHHVTSVRPQKT